MLRFSFFIWIRIARASPATLPSHLFLFSSLGAWHSKSTVRREGGQAVFYDKCYVLAFLAFVFIFALPLLRFRPTVFVFVSWSMALEIHGTLTCFRPSFVLSVTRLTNSSNFLSSDPSVGFLIAKTATLGRPNIFPRWPDESFKAQIGILLSWHITRKWLIRRGGETFVATTTT